VSADVGPQKDPRVLVGLHGTGGNPRKSGGPKGAGGDPEELMGSLGS